MLQTILGSTYTGILQNDYLRWNGTGSWINGSSQISIGGDAGVTGQGDYSVALGSSAGFFAQGSSAVAIGVCAGYSGQANNSICIGALSGASAARARL